MQSTPPLAHVRIVSLALNLPGPVAVRRLADAGARINKIEPPDGDPLLNYAPTLYQRLHAGLKVEPVDLKSPAGQSRLDELLSQADLLITAQRPPALERLGLGPESVPSRWPQLAHVAIVGHAGAESARSGHDLTYLAEAGLIDPQALPRTLMSDMLGAEQAVSAACMLLLDRQRGRPAGRTVVSLAEAAESLAQPLRHELTGPGGLLSGADPRYRCYRTADGIIALAVLEPHFARRLQEALAGETLSVPALEAAFAARPTKHWLDLATRLDLPLVALPGLPSCA